MHQRPAMPASDVPNCVSYNPETGVFRRARVSGNKDQYKIGDIAGGLSSSGYLTIKIDGRAYSGQRLAFAFMTGRWPRVHMDHINGNRADNRWANLRECTRSENLWNMGANKRNTSGFKGVYKHKNVWRSTITQDNKRIHLGLFATPELAFAAYVKKQAELHKDFARMGREALVILKRTNLLNSGLDVEWQSWPMDKPRPALWATGRVEATAEFFDQISAWYPDFAVRVCQDQPEAALNGRPLIEVLEAYAA